jgi:hypothetical protein
MAPELPLIAGSQDELIGIAIARGCDHYRPYVPPALRVDRPELAHEVLGCALLQGPQEVETFQGIRVGAMVLSDPGCSPARIAASAAAFGVAARVAHIARLALSVNDAPDYWRAVLAALPAGTTADEQEREFLPGISRFASETGMRGAGLGFARVWLRTDYVAGRLQERSGR